MKPIEFKEQTHLMGKEQPEFEVLPVCITKAMPEQGYPGEIISAWELSDEDLELIKTTKVVYLRVQGSAQPPVFLEVKSPFVPVPEDFKPDVKEPQIITLNPNNN